MVSLIGTSRGRILVGIIVVMALLADRIRARHLSDADRIGNDICSLVPAYPPAIIRPQAANKIMSGSRQGDCADLNCVYY
jgi:hypothetical protein